MTTIAVQDGSVAHFRLGKIRTTPSNTKYLDIYCILYSRETGWSIDALRTRIQPCH